MLKLRKKNKAVNEILEELKEIQESQKRAERMLREAVIQLTNLNQKESR